jgi:CRP-like cAMP-binding protein/predicted MFS family arabinose efflux permease
VSLGGSYRAALKRRDMRLLVTSFVVDGLGSWAYSTVLLVYIYERTGSATWVAAATACRWIPGLVFASLGGVVADRFERTRVMIVSALVSAVLVGLMAIVVATDAPLVLLLLLSGLAATAYVPYRPAAGALTPDVVDEKELAAANALFSALESLTVVLGPAVGGLLLLTGQPTIAIVLNAVSFLVAALCVSRVRTRSRGGGGETGEGIGRQLADGFAALRAQRVAVVLVLFCALDSAIFGASTVLYAPISQHLGTGVAGYSYLLAGSALGGLLAAALADRLSRSPRLAPVIVGGIMLQALPFALTTVVHNPPVGFVLQVISGVGMIIVDVLAITALQRDIPRELLSRVLSIGDMAIFGATLAASFVFAAVYTAYGLQTSLLVLGIGFPVAALLGIRPLLVADRRAVATIRELAPRIALLRALDLFVAASNNTLERLAADLEPVEFPAGAMVLREGDPADALYVIVDGEVSASARGEGETEQFLRTVGPGGYVGEIGLLTAGPRTATVTAVTPLTMWRLPGDDFLDALQESQASSALLQTSGARLARTHPRLAAASPDGPAPIPQGKHARHDA